MKLPTISIVTCSYNTDLKIFSQTLLALKKQNYPKSKIEHFVMDGGSTNGLVELAKKNRCQVILRKDLLNTPLERMRIGINMAKNDLVLFLEPDNIIQGKNWFKQMVLPFILEPDVVGAFSKYNGFTKKMPLLTKYYALIGANDPVLLFLNKSEKLPRSENTYKRNLVKSKRRTYTKLVFSRDNLPTLGDNGHMVRRNIITKVSKKKYMYLHTDAFADLLKMGYATYAAVNNSIIHYAGGDILGNLKRRLGFKEKYTYKNIRRTYLVFNPNSKEDRINLLKFILYSLTLIQPLIFSIRGYNRYSELAWFLHPVVCFGTAIAYSVSEVKFRLKNLI